MLTVVGEAKAFIIYPNNNVGETSKGILRILVT